MADPKVRASTALLRHVMAQSFHFYEALRPPIRDLLRHRFCGLEGTDAGT